MGTRGVYAYKWRCKYYVYYNHYDSYPSGLGKGLVGDIPRDPERYQRWLEQLRSKYSVLADEIFTVSMDKFGEDDPSVEALEALESLDNMPDCSAPRGDLWIEWVYVFDLDREIFSIHNACFFHLSKISLDFEEIMEEAQEYWLGNVDQSDVHESITTDDILPAPLAHDPTPAFLQMTPTTVDPKHESRLNYMPAFIVCKRLYELFVQNFKDSLRQAQDCHNESDFLFRELVFSTLCFASCSPEWVRLISTSSFKHKEYKSTDWAYGAILDAESGKPKEFTTRFLQGYHLEGKETGSAPGSTSYWFSGALVYLRRDITTRERFQDAIASAVERGKADSQTHFHAIIISLKHFILLKFADGNVQHTKRLNMNASPGFVKEKVMRFYKQGEEENEEDSQDETEGEDAEIKEDTGNQEPGQPGRHSAGKEDTTDDDGSKRVSGEAVHSAMDEAPQDDPNGIEDWFKNRDVAAFDIMAHFFHAIQNEKLKPSIVHNEGVFPNEVYRRILQFVDRETNIACLQVSRAFREFAMETFVMDKGLKAVYRPRQEPECISVTSGQLGRFTPKISRESHYQNGYEWIPVFGKPDGSASAEPTIVLQLSRPAGRERHHCPLLGPNSFSAV